MRRINEESRVPASFNHDYVLINTLSGQVVCDPTTYFECRQIAEELNIKEFEIAEYVVPVKSNIDYSVLDQF